MGEIFMQLIKFTLNDGDEPKVIPMNVNSRMYQVSIQVVPSGGAVYSVYGTLDNPQEHFPLDFFPVSATFINQNQAQQDYFQEPVRAYQFSVTGGPIEVKIQQQGIK